jgi:hypothetical protein
MTDTDNMRPGSLTTEQIAAAGVGSDDPTVQEPTETADPTGDGQDSASEHAQLLETDEVNEMVVRWKAIQTNFVDEPRRAVQDADALVADLMQRLAQMFASERGHLESQWAGGGDVSTEDLRQGLQRYRSFFERLLAV